MYPAENVLEFICLKKIDFLYLFIHTLVKERIFDVEDDIIDHTLVQPFLQTSKLPMLKKGLKASIELNEWDPSHHLQQVAKQLPVSHLSNKYTQKACFTTYKKQNIINKILSEQVKN